jgi:hypothetical protein
MTTGRSPKLSHDLGIAAVAWSNVAWSNVAWSNDDSLVVAQYAGKKTSRALVWQRRRYPNLCRSMLLGIDRDARCGDRVRASAGMIMYVSKPRVSKETLSDSAFGIVANTIPTAFAEIAGIL